MIPPLIPPQAPLQELIHGPLPSTPPPVCAADNDIVYGLSTMGEAGRIMERYVMAALQWLPGTRLEVRPTGRKILLIHPAADGQSAVDIVVVDGNDQVVAMGRIIGDGALYGLIVDVIVDPRHQGCGFGTLIMNRITEWAGRSTLHHVGLATDRSVAQFYTHGWDIQDSGRYLRLPRSAG